MQNPINWFERLKNGAKREVRVTVARQRVVWAFRVLGEDAWEEKTQPSAEHWDDLLQKIKTVINAEEPPRWRLNS